MSTFIHYYLYHHHKQGKYSNTMKSFYLFLKQRFTNDPVLTRVRGTYIRAFAVMLDASLSAMCLGVLVILSYSSFLQREEGNSVMLSKV